MLKKKRERYSIWYTENEMILIQIEVFEEQNAVRGSQMKSSVKKKNNATTNGEKNNSRKKKQPSKKKKKARSRCQRMMR